MDEVRFNKSTDIRVPVRLGRGISIGVKQHWWVEAKRDLADLAETATEFAANIATAHEMRDEIVEMTREVRAAVSREIAKATRRGLPYRLLSADPAAAYDDLRSGAIVEVVFERLSEHLRPGKATFSAGCAEDVAQAFAHDREPQEFRVMCRADLNAAGATGRIDSVVVNAMRDAGHDVAEVLKELATNDDRTLVVGTRPNAGPSFLSDPCESHGNRFRLHWNDGDVFGQVTLAGGVSWHEGWLNFQDAPVSLAKVEGRRVRDIVDNPIFGEIRVVSGSGKKGGTVSLYCTSELLNFDGESGRLWAA
jgi:hypothetical protein